MPRISKQLTDTEIKKAKYIDKRIKLSDGGGLCLIITKTSKRWQFDYSYDKKRNSLSLGLYPNITLKNARDKRDELKVLLANGKNPSEVKKEKLEQEELDKTNTFYLVSREYLSTRTDISDNHKMKLERVLTKDIDIFIGNKNIDHIKALEVLEIIKKIESRGAVETAHRTFNLIERIFKYGATIGRVKHNIMADIDKNIALKAPKSKNLTHTTDISVLSDIMKSIEHYRGDISTKIALMITPYLFLRPFNIRTMEWDEINYDKKVISIPAQKMKMKKAHLVPLTDTVIKLLKEIEPYTKHKSSYVFCSPLNTKNPLSDNAINQALKRLGFKDITVAHGFRHTASTLLHENIHIHKINSDVIEAQLAHVKNDVRAVYNKANYWDERVRLMNWWSDYLDGLKK